jgi:hypothetical protein
MTMLKGPLRQRGAAMVEFAVVGPVVTLLGLGSLQYGLMFFAKNQLNHAAFMAARAGTTEHADKGKMAQALTRALVPMYGGGGNTTELAASYARALADVTAYTRIEILNPTKESFDDWNSNRLQARYGRRAIPNAHLAEANPGDIRANSGQNLQDANLLKLRITYGYEPKVPLMGGIYAKYIAWLDTGGDAFNTGLIAARRIPMVTHVTLLMQSDALEDNPVSSPGPGNNGTPTDPGEPPVVDTPPPKCGTIGCTTPPGPLDPGGGGGGGSDCERPGNQPGGLPG